MIKQENCLIVSHREIAANIYELILHGQIVNEMASPGQFVHVRVADSFEPLLRRPISIAHIDKEKNQFTLIYRKSGKGTRLLTMKLPGETVDILGPLGNGFPVDETDENQTALLVGGGIGIPPLYELAKQLHGRGVTVISVLGVRSKEFIFYEEKFKQYSTTYIVTEDGSYGEKGFVTNIIAEKNLDFDCLYSCGPLPMLKAMETYAPEKKVYLSLEERMGCGIGACFACVCKTSSHLANSIYKKVCTDGPVFAAGEVEL